MGGQAKPVENEMEIERALASMRAGFATGSGQIAAGIASLEEYLAEAPAEEQEAIRAAIGKIVNAHAHLKARMQSLQGPSWERFKVMVGLAKAQQTVLDEVSHLVKQHVLPRQLENLGAPPPAGPGAGHSPTPQGESFQRAQDAVQALNVRRAQEARRAHHTYADEEDEGRSWFSRARQRAAGFSGLAAMVIAAVVLGVIPRDTASLQHLASRIGAMVGVTFEVASSAPDGTSDPEPLAAPPAPQPRSDDRVPPPPEVAAATERSDPPAAAPLKPDKKADTKKPDKKGGSGPAVKPDKKGAPPPTPARQEVAAAAPPPASPDPAAPPAEAEPAEKGEPAPAATDDVATPPAEEKFVPVVFTHKDAATVQQAMVDLKQRYPNLLIGRTGEVQPVDLGKKGIWHRLVVMPPGPRLDATRLCDQLLAKGYDRCWVKEYQ